MTTTLEFMVPKAESEAFNTAVYRFIEMRVSALSDDVVKVRSEPLGPVERKEVTLWSDAAMHDFTVFWSSVRPPATARYRVRVP